MKLAIGLFAALLAAGCARTETVRMSGNTMMIKTNAAPICGSSGAARAASQMAAIETLRAGYDSYVVLGQEAQNNVKVLDGGGTVYSQGSASFNGSAFRSGSMLYGSGTANYGGSSTYVPNMPIMVGTHDQGLMVRMFRASDPEGVDAIDARQILGADWQDKVRSGANARLR